MSNTPKKPLVLALGAAFALTGLGAQAASFQAADLGAGYMVAAAGHHEKAGEHKCGEGKCGEGKCGEGKDAKAGDEKKSGEHKCGEGKCGEGKCGEAKPQT
ncbi:MAG TPA: hypothetical protein VFV27_07285 [Nevskiaceae bacterium]|nr:hypothetical protein [Nevskiaceae bacterium]